MQESGGLHAAAERHTARHRAEAAAVPALPDESACCTAWSIRRSIPETHCRFPLREIGDKDRVDVIMTNPPFGGEEERGILSNFPEDKQTAETALLFLQLIMRKLRRPVGGSKGGRCGMVVPNGVLFGDGIALGSRRTCSRSSICTRSCACRMACLRRTRRSRRTSCSLIAREPTKDIWYYEQPLPEGRKNYTKTAPIQFEEFDGCLKWWKKREENERAWKVKAANVLKYDSDGNLLSVNLDVKNPRAKEDITHLPPEQLAESILQKEQRIVEIIGQIKQALASK